MSTINNLLSFLCVSYNHEKYIEDCIKSIWENDYKNIEIFVLDDGSTDNSLCILNKLKEQSPFPMQIFSQNNTGKIGANFNKLINKANGNFISIIACDDKLVENSLNVKMQELLNNKNLAYICHSKIICIDENDKVISKYPKMDLDNIENPTPEDILKLDFNKIHSYYTQGSIFRKNIIDCIQGFDEDMICDDIILRTKLSRYLLAHPELSFKVMHNPSVYYRRHSNNISSNTIRQVKGVLQYYKRDWGDRELPKMFYEWLYNLNKDGLLELLIEDKYKINIFNNLKTSYIKSVMFPNEYPYKKQGIPLIFQVLSYRQHGIKTKIIKLFGIQIYKYTKEIKYN